MRFHLWSLLILYINLAACSRTGPIPAFTESNATPQIPVTPAPTLTPTALSATSTADLLTATDSPTQTQEQISTPTSTFTDWEMVQAQVSRFRNLLDSGSDGYVGLTLALEQEAPTQEWCAGINPAIGDFNYVGDTANAQALEALQESQGCP